MSAASAIASVTQVLKEILNDRISDSGISAAVSSLSPGKIEMDGTETNRINLFMYLVTPNLGWRNHGYPSHNGRGEAVSNPPLALDLHYVLSAYSEQELYPELLLGNAMQTFHEYPVLARKNIEFLLSSERLSDFFSVNMTKSLSTSGLADQLEQIKLSPETLNTEEISRLWTAFGAKYRPSAFYKASVVLIESNKAIQPSLPVQERIVQVTAVIPLVISSLSSQSEGDQNFIVLTIKPFPTEKQKVTLLLDEIVDDNSSITPATYVFEYDNSHMPSANPIAIPIQAVDAGDYLVRIKVDNKESLTGEDLKTPFVSIT